MEETSIGVPGWIEKRKNKNKKLQWELEKNLNIFIHSREKLFSLPKDP